jgi:peptidoglycan hydrolase-like protein with peptidoglycan-binding domain
MLRKVIPIFLFIASMTPGVTCADDLTQLIQQDLTTLGYDPGNTDGELTTKTVVAISKFQAEHDLDVTGEVSPQLAGVIKAAIKQQTAPAPEAGAQAAAAAPATQDPAALEAARQACLQEKIAQAQESKKKKRGFGSLMRAVGRTASQLGGNATARRVAETSRDVYDANATAADLESAAEDLGLTPDDLEACRNP